LTFLLLSRLVVVSFDSYLFFHCAVFKEHARLACCAQCPVLSVRIFPDTSHRSLATRESCLHPSGACSLKIKQL
jgi:hypothetical protein